MNHLSICSLKKPIVHKINSYLASIGRQKFSPEYIKAIKNSAIFDEILNTNALNFRGFFIDLSHSENPDESNKYALVLNSAVNGSYTDVLMLHSNFEPSSVEQILM